MTYALLKFAHVLGAILIGGGLIAVWFSDLRSRQLRELPQLSEAVRNIAVFYDGVVVPGVEGNTITRLYFMRLRRLTGDALKAGVFTPALERARAENLPTFTHFLDLPLLFLIVALGVIKPDTWTLFISGSVIAVLVASILTLYIPRLYPWSMKEKQGVSPLHK